jgi:putative restriction endonuclease
MCAVRNAARRGEKNLPAVTRECKPSIKDQGEFDHLLAAVQEVDFKLVKQKDRSKGEERFKRENRIAYRYRCAITGSKWALHSAHIKSHQTEADHHIQNGILMRSDFHTMYDEGLMRIDCNFRVWFAEEVDDEYYRSFHGKQISLPDNPKHWPDPLLLQIHDEESGWRD